MTELVISPVSQPQRGSGSDKGAEDLLGGGGSTKFRPTAETSVASLSLAGNQKFLTPQDHQKQQLLMIPVCDVTALMQLQLYSESMCEE